MMVVPVNEPLLNGNEKKYLNECIDSGYISSEGPFVKRFEDAMAVYIGRKHAIAVTSGTVAIDLAVESLDLQKGDEVIMPTFTIISCVAGLLKKGCKPVFVDQQPDTWNMDVTQIEEKITKQTRAIMVVHIYGLPVDMNPVIDVCKKYNLLLIEDAAEMHGQEYYGKKCGSFGDISIMSFYPNKIITTGEGGMIFTDNDFLAEKCRSLRNLCFIPEQRFFHYDLGYNARITNLQAAVGLAQLEKIEEHINKKRLIGKTYQERLCKVKNIQLPLSKTVYAENIYWVFGILINKDFPGDAKNVSNVLAKSGIGTRPFFWCLHQQPLMKKFGLSFKESYPISENLSKRGLYIPSGLALTNEQINYVSERIIEIFS